MPRLGWLQELRRRRAAKIYAARLPAVLAENWGRSSTYTPGQIKAAIKLAHAPLAHVAIAMAAYLEEPAYREVMGPSPEMPYLPARRLFYAVLGTPENFAVGNNTSDKAYVAGQLTTHWDQSEP